MQGAQLPDERFAACSHAFLCSSDDALQTSRWVTVFWGLAAMGVALLASLYENLIQLVNLIGSLFYGPMLGIFVCAWLFKRLPWRAVFWGSVC